jgi:hypothetical protein
MKPPNRPTAAAIFAFGLVLGALPVAADTTPGSKAGSELVAVRAALSQDYGRCERWAGEEADDEEREAEVMRGFEQDCPRAFATAKKAYARAGRDPLVAAIIVDLETFAGQFFEEHRVIRDETTRERLCATAARYYRNPATGRWRFRGYFEELCPAQTANLPAK